MSVATAQPLDVPAALPVVENEDEREKLIKQAANENKSADDDSSPESDDDEEFDDAAGLAKPSKKKLFLAFVCFVFCFVLLLTILCWFFGIGIFAATKPQAVDRTAKTNQSSAPVTEEEKLKMALNLVAEKTPDGQSDTVSTNSNLSADLAGDSFVNIPRAVAADVPEPVIVPDALSLPDRNSVNALTTDSGESKRMRNPLLSGGNQSLPNGGKVSPIIDNLKRESETDSIGRSLFFGVSHKEKSVTTLLSGADNQTVFRRETGDSANVAAAIPFGTLLPVRFLGAVYTLRASGGLVRMELTRSVAGKNYSYPAGTVLVGTLRGSEYKRAFVSVVGLIDPKSSGLVKFEGEVMGSDGASGVSGRRRKVKSSWSRALAGLRDAGAVALGAIGNNRSGGTVVISDSATRASGAISEELSALVGGSRKADEFVEIVAGTNAYILVTDLPDEISSVDTLAQNSKSATGLAENELADLISEGSPEKLRAALPRMTPNFRRLAETALAAMGTE